jgi:hypothetical protein
MAKDPNAPSSVVSNTAVDAFLRQVAAAPQALKSQDMGRLIFAMDATASRQPTWDRASQIQAEMFSECASLGGLAIQLCYFRGFGEFRATPWLTDSRKLVSRMEGVTCLSGNTQIIRVLRHAIVQASQARVNALVYVGDALEEGPAVLAELAARLGMLGVPAFVFQEGDEPVAQRSFRQIARSTGGAYMSFNADSATALRDLLKGVAVYAAGGRNALVNYAQRTGGDVLRLTRQLR